MGRNYFLTKNKSNKKKIILQMRAKIFLMLISIAFINAQNRMLKDKYPDQEPGLIVPQDVTDKVKAKINTMLSKCTVADKLKDKTWKPKENKQLDYYSTEVLTNDKGHVYGMRHILFFEVNQHEVPTSY